MPAPNIAAWAKMKGKSSKEIEKYWTRAKERVMDQYGLKEPTKSTKKEQRKKFYSLTMAIFKKMLRIKESSGLSESARSELKIISSLRG